MSKNLTAEEKRAWILENCIDEYGDIDLSHLDFSDVDRVVITSDMKVKTNLWQMNQQVKGDLHQNNQQVKGFLDQSEQQVQGDLVQSYQKVKGDLDQAHQEVQGNLYQWRTRKANQREM